MARRVLFVPDFSKSNPYQTLLGESVSAHGFDVALRDFPLGPFAINRLIHAESPIYAIHLHWINDLVGPILWSTNAYKRHVKIAMLALDILIARLRGVRIVWTIHNLVAHECQDPAVEIHARRVIAKASTCLFVHSLGALRLVEKTYGANIQNKTLIVPHSNFDGCYPLLPGSDQRLKARYDLGSEVIVILFFGAIRRYKGLEKLIASFRAVPDERLRLLIAGNCGDPALDRAIKEAARSDPRIIATLGFVPDEDVAAHFAIADVVAIPFERILTSASAMLAFTMGKALLVPNRARVFDYVNDGNALFFQSDEELGARIAALDKRRLAVLGRNGRSAVEGFTWMDMGARVAAGYEGRRKGLPVR